MVNPVLFGAVTGATRKISALQQQEANKQAEREKLLFANNLKRSNFEFESDRKEQDTIEAEQRKADAARVEDKRQRDQNAELARRSGADEATVEQIRLTPVKSAGKLLEQITLGGGYNPETQIFETRAEIEGSKIGNDIVAAYEEQYKGKNFPDQLKKLIKRQAKAGIIKGQADFEAKNGRPVLQDDGTFKLVTPLDMKLQNKIDVAKINARAARSAAALRDKITGPQIKQFEQNAHRVMGGSFTATNLAKSPFIVQTGTLGEKVLIPKTPEIRAYSVALQALQAFNVKQKGSTNREVNVLTAGEPALQMLQQDMGKLAQQLGLDTIVNLTNGKLLVDDYVEFVLDPAIPLPTKKLLSPTNLVAKLYTGGQTAQQITEQDITEDPKTGAPITLNDVIATSSSSLEKKTNAQAALVLAEELFKANDTTVSDNTGIIMQTLLALRRELAVSPSRADLADEEAKLESMISFFRKIMQDEILRLNEEQNKVDEAVDTVG